MSNRLEDGREPPDLATALRAVVSEAWYVLSGGDDPAERCQECGCAGYGDLRDALKQAEAALAAHETEKQKTCGGE